MSEIYICFPPSSFLLPPSSFLFPRPSSWLLPGAFCCDKHWYCIICDLTVVDNLSFIYIFCNSVESLSAIALGSDPLGLIVKAHILACPCFAGIMANNFCKVVMLDDARALQWLTVGDYANFVPISKMVQQKFAGVIVFICRTQCQAMKKPAGNKLLQCTNTANYMNGAFKVCGVHRDKDPDVMPTIWGSTVSCFLPSTALVQAEEGHAEARVGEAFHCHIVGLAWGCRVGWGGGSPPFTLKPNQTNPLTK